MRRLWGYLPFNWCGGMVMLDTGWVESSLNTKTPSLALFTWLFPFLLISVWQSYSVIIGSCLNLMILLVLKAAKQLVERQLIYTAIQLPLISYKTSIFLILLGLVLSPRWHLSLLSPSRDLSDIQYRILRRHQSIGDTSAHLCLLTVPIWVVVWWIVCVC